MKGSYISQIVQIPANKKRKYPRGTCESIFIFMYILVRMTLLKESTLFFRHHISNFHIFPTFHIFYSFQNSCVIETCLLNFHKMMLTVMKTTLNKPKSKMTIETTEIFAMTYSSRQNIFTPFRKKCTLTR